eukprot:417838-Prymnesium_polylepis.1
MHVKAAIDRLDPDHLGPQHHPELRRLSQLGEVVRILLARRVLLVQRVRGRRAVGDGVEIETVSPALLVE